MSSSVLHAVRRLKTAGSNRKTTRLFVAFLYFTFTQDRTRDAGRSGRDETAATCSQSQNLLSSHMAFQLAVALLGLVRLAPLRDQECARGTELLRVHCKSDALFGATLDELVLTLLQEGEHLEHELAAMRTDLQIGRASCRERV